MGDLIRTTAKYQEAEAPTKQKPIIQIEPNRPLPNTIRASIDSGRDNPFRPDGKIYKSADPIVDYYKYGPNQSRTHSPTDSQLLLNGSSSKDAKKRKRKKRDQDPDGQARKPCWRRWLCCCCCCCSCKWSRCCRKDKVDEETEQEKAQSAKAETKQPKIVVLKEENNSDSFVINGSNTGDRPTITVDLATNNTTETSDVTTPDGPVAQENILGNSGSSTQAKSAKSSRCVIS